MVLPRHMSDCRSHVETRCICWQGAFLAWAPPVFFSVYRLHFISCTEVRSGDGALSGARIRDLTYSYFQAGPLFSKTEMFWPSKCGDLAAHPELLGGCCIRSKEGCFGTS